MPFPVVPAALIPVCSCVRQSQLQLSGLSDRCLWCVPFPVVPADLTPACCCVRQSQLQLSGLSAIGSLPLLSGNTPCSTLFVANLGQTVTEEVLKEVFST